MALRRRVDPLSVVFPALVESPRGPGQPKQFTPSARSESRPPTTICCGILPTATTTSRLPARFGRCRTTRSRTRCWATVDRRWTVCGCISTPCPPGRGCGMRRGRICHILRTGVLYRTTPRNHESRAGRGANREAPVARGGRRRGLTGPAHRSGRPYALVYDLSAGLAKKDSEHLVSVRRPVGGPTIQAW